MNDLSNPRRPVEVADGVFAVINGDVRDEIERRGARPELVLNTHHHADHVGGNAAFPGARLVAHPVTAGIVRSMAGRTGELGRLMPAYASELARLELRPPEPGINFRRALQEVRGEIDRANLLA